MKAVLTQKKAMQLVRHVLYMNLKPKPEKEEGLRGPAYSFSTRCLQIKVERYKFKGRDLLSLFVTTGLSVSMRLFFDPETLEEDYEAEDAYQKILQEEKCESCRYRTK